MNSASAIGLSPCSAPAGTRTNGALECWLGAVLSACWEKGSICNWNYCRECKCNSVSIILPVMKGNKCRGTVWGRGLRFDLRRRLECRGTGEGCEDYKSTPSAHSPSVGAYLAAASLPLHRASLCLPVTLRGKLIE